MDSTRGRRGGGLSEQQGVQNVSFGAQFDSRKFFEDRGPEDDSRTQKEPGKGEEKQNLIGQCYSMLSVSRGFDWSMLFDAIREPWI